MAGVDIWAASAYIRVRYLLEKMGRLVGKESRTERQRRYKLAKKLRDPEGWKKLRREQKRRARERRGIELRAAYPWRLRKGEKAQMSPEERREHERSINRRSRLRKAYGLSHDQYDEMVEKQSGKCAICDQPCSLLVVDHCHTNGHVRGLLCNFCNTGLGFFRDTPAFLEAAARYLG